jgi:hypothetical protein
MGYQAALVRRQLTPGLISSLPGRSDCRRLSFFRQATVSWTLPCDVLCVGLANGRRNISRSLKLLCLKRNIENLSAIQEKSAIPLGDAATSGLSANRIRSRYTHRRRLPDSPSTAQNLDLDQTALLRLALNPSKWFRKQCGVSENLILLARPQPWW